MKQPKSLAARLLSLALFALCLGFLFWTAARPNPSDKARQEERLYQAVWRSALHCYAVEGRYPPTLDYLEEVYGLHINRDEFLVEYQRHGGNIAPNIQILRIGQ